MIKHRRVFANGIGIHIAEAGSGPPVILLHGFPETWYSWRHQLPALAAAGYHAIAPDVRGCGETDAPEGIAPYSKKSLIGDVLGLMDALGEREAAIVGHDWGALVAWDVAELHPERVSAIVALGVPYHARGPEPPTAMIAKFARGRFSFVHAFQEPGAAEAELEADARSTLRRFYYALSGDAPEGLVPHLFKEKPPGARILDGMPDPEALPGWLAEADLDVYARAYGRTGFRGALGPYRNMDRDWAELERSGAAGVGPPALFVGGDRDAAVRFGSLEPMKAAAANMRKAVILPGCGHWTQQERPAEVNAEIIGFLGGEIGE